MHLTVGTEVGTFIDQDSKRVIELPFTLCLDSFRVEYYPGTEAPLLIIIKRRLVKAISLTGEDTIHRNWFRIPNITDREIFLWWHDTRTGCRRLVTPSGGLAE